MFLKLKSAQVGLKIGFIKDLIKESTQIYAKKNIHLQNCSNLKLIKTNSFCVTY